MADLNGQIAIVTGASRGIGRGIAERLERDGAYVVVNYSGSEKDADEVVDAISDAGGRSVSIQADLSSIADIQTLFAKRMFEKGGRGQKLGQAPDHDPDEGQVDKRL